jgi:hypothetical protein
MNASRTHHSRQIQYHAPDLKFDGAEAIRRQIIRLLTRRENAQSLKQIQKWFRGTNLDFVRDNLNVLVDDGKVRLFRPSLGRAKHNCAYRYEIHPSYFPQEIEL